MSISPVIRRWNWLLASLIDNIRLASSRKSARTRVALTMRAAVKRAMRPSISGSIEMLVDGFTQASEADRFSEHGIHGSRRRPGDFNQGTESGEENDGKRRMQLFDQFSRLVAAHLRHSPIKK